MEEDVVATIQGFGSVEEYVADLYKTSSHAKVREAVLPQLRATLADRSEELKQAVYENYQDFLTTTHAVEKVEADLLEIHELLNAVGSTLEELNHHFANELNEQQAKLSKLLERKACELAASGFLPRDETAAGAPAEDAAALAERRRAMLASVVFVLDAPARLDISLSQWDFKACVELIEGVRRLRTSDALPRNALKGHDALRQFEAMEARVAEKLKQRLSDMSLSAGQTRQIVGHLQRVTSDERALAILLESRREQAAARVGKELRDATPSGVAQEVCGFAFRLMRSTWDDVQACFGHDGAALSAVLAWSVELLNSVLAGVVARVSQEVQSNALKVAAVTTVHSLYNATIPKELACAFLVRRHLTPLVASLQKPVATADKEALVALSYKLVN